MLKNDKNLKERASIIRFKVMLSDISDRPEVWLSDPSDFYEAARLVRGIVAVSDFRLNGSELKKWVNSKYGTKDERSGFDILYDQFSSKEDPVRFLLGEIYNFANDQIGTTMTLVQDIQSRAGTAPIKVGLILGSGLGHIAETVEGTAIDYGDLPGFPHAGVSGHNPKLVIGDLEGTRVAVLGGRAHYYEKGDANAMRLPLETLKALGAEQILLTNAAGSFRKDIPPGDLMLLSDHINFSGRNPLIGEPSDARFVNMTDAYDKEMRHNLAETAAALDIALKSGVYAWYSGPSFETPAEIKALHTLGADAVGMSTVPEVILCRFLGLRVAAISTITNMAAGMSDEVLSHEHTKAMAPIGAAKLENILRHYLRTL